MSDENEKENIASGGFVSKTSFTSGSLKRPRPGSQDSPVQTDFSYAEVSDTLIAIDTKLSSLDSRIALIELLHKEFNCIQKSLEFSQAQILELTRENTQLRHSVNTLTTQMATVVKENKSMNETILYLQSRSMRDNLIFSGIAEPPPGGATPDPEQAVKDFMTNQLKIPSDTVKQIAFHRVHRLGPAKNGLERPRPIIVKFEHYKQKEMVKQKGRELKGTDFGMNDQFPRVIVERRKILFPIRKQFLEARKKAVISVDRLYAL